MSQEQVINASQEQVINAISPFVSWLRLGVESVGVLIIAAGVLVALWQLLRALFARQGANFNSIRLLLARYLALALEFQLAADILSTAVRPSPQEITQLATIAVIRTGLNYFLGKEMREERETIEGEHKVQRDVSG